MTKQEWQVHHGFTDEDMTLIDLALSISGGKISDIFKEPLKYQDIKITLDKTRLRGNISTKGGKRNG